VQQQLEPSEICKAHFGFEGGIDRSADQDPNVWLCPSLVSDYSPQGYRYLHHRDSARLTETVERLGHMANVAPQDDEITDESLLAAARTAMKDTKELLDFARCVRHEAGHLAMLWIAGWEPRLNDTFCCRRRPGHGQTDADSPAWAAEAAPLQPLWEFVMADANGITKAAADLTSTDLSRGTAEVGLCLDYLLAGCVAEYPEVDTAMRILQDDGKEATSDYKKALLVIAAAKLAPESKRDAYIYDRIKQVIEVLFRENRDKLDEAMTYLAYKHPPTT
jgi:hypothetical protein